MLRTRLTVSMARRSAVAEASVVASEADEAEEAEIEDHQESLRHLRLLRLSRRHELDVLY